MAGAIGGLMVTLLLVAWLLGQVTTEPLKGLFTYLALHNLHFDPFSRGIVNASDVAFYAGLTLFFVEAAVRSLESWGWRE